MNQRTIFDLPRAREARDQAMSQVERHAPEGWEEVALVGVREVCERQPDFIVDDVWKTGIPRPKEARALGPVIIKAAKLGWCSKTDNYRPSSQKQCHANPRRVWRSNLYR